MISGDETFIVYVCCKAGDMFYTVQVSGNTDVRYEYNHALYILVESLKKQFANDSYHAFMRIKTLTDYYYIPGKSLLGNSSSYKLLTERYQEIIPLNKAAEIHFKNL